MATSGQLLFNFRQAEDKAKRIDEIAESLRSLARTDMDRMNQEIAAAWQGDNAKQYLAKAAQLQSGIDRTHKELLEIARTIRRTAKIIYDAEMEALRIANMRDAAKRDG